MWTSVLGCPDSNAPEVDRAPAVEARSPGVPAGRWLRSGFPAAHERDRLRLLPPGSDLVRERSPRGTWPSTPFTRRTDPEGRPLGRGFGPTRADCGCRAPLPPRLARSTAEGTRPRSDVQPAKQRAGEVAEHGHHVA